MLVPSTKDRVPAHTSTSVNRQIQQATQNRVAALKGHPELVRQRLAALDREWDIERAIEMNASALAFAGTSLGAAHDKRWLTLPLLVTAFLFQHAVQGWCPPVPILRRLGFRTAYEIEEERRQLLALSRPIPRRRTSRSNSKQRRRSQNRAAAA